MGRGSRCGPDRSGAGVRFGVGMFVEDGAYTTLASAVAVLVALTLTFSSVTAVWTASRSQDIQVVADSASMAGSNVVASYHTAATVVDACILSLGLTGFAMAGAGLAGLLVPGANAAAGKLIDAGIEVLKTRNSFAQSASKGLKGLEGALPYLVAANASRTVSELGSESATYTGTAVAVPRDSASEFPAIDGGEIETDGLEASAGELDQAAGELAKAQEASQGAKREAWRPDCDETWSNGRHMQERVDSLTALSGPENPLYRSSATWHPQVALDRARAYYAQRIADERPTEGGAEGEADSAARLAFFEFAASQLGSATLVDNEGECRIEVPRMPENAEDVSNTALMNWGWPTTVEAGGLTLHYGLECPGAKGAQGAYMTVLDLKLGAVEECTECQFSVESLGDAVKPSSFSPNLFEYHFNRYVDALDAYRAAREREIVLEEKARGMAVGASAAFDEALSALSGKRPRIAPPGRNGCLSLVVSEPIASPELAGGSLAPAVETGRCGAMSASVLAPEEATRENNVLAQFLSSIEQPNAGDAPMYFIGSVMDLWGSLLLSYGNLGDALTDFSDRLARGVGAGGAIAQWLADAVGGALRGLGLEAVDLRLRKPVLTDSANVIAFSGMPGLADAQGMLRSIPAGATDPEALLEAVGYGAVERLDSLEVTLAEIPVPGAGSIPLTVRVRDLKGIFDRADDG